MTSTLEERLVIMVRETPRRTMRELLASDEVASALARHSRARAHERGVRQLETQRPALAEAARRAHDDDLDAAWTLALRGEFDQARSRLAAYAQPQRRVKPHKGTPWRMTGWLDTRGR
jgi:hypothetical protein